MRFAVAVAGGLAVAGVAITGCSSSTAHTGSDATTVTSAETQPTMPMPATSPAMSMPTTSPAMSMRSATGSATVPGGTTAHGTIGPLTVTGAYIPAPASPSVAAAYFRISSTSGKPDGLLSVTTPVSTTATLHHYVKSRGGGMTMVALNGGLRIPAHGSARLLPGKSHLMISSPNEKLTQGMNVALTLHFRHAGSLTLQVPVVSAAGPAEP